MYVAIITDINQCSVCEVDEKNFEILCDGDDVLIITEAEYKKFMSSEGLKYNEETKTLYYDILPKAPETPQHVRITREDFDLLDVTYANTIYYITEPDNTVTIVRGED